MAAPNRPANDGIHSRSVIWRVEALHTRNPHIISNPLTNIRKAAAAAKSAKALFRFPDFNPMNSSSKKKTRGGREVVCNNRKTYRKVTSQSVTDQFSRFKTSNRTSSSSHSQIRSTRRRRSTHPTTHQHSPSHDTDKHTRIRNRLRKYFSIQRRRKIDLKQKFAKKREREKV